MTLLLGDCVERMRELDAGSVDAICTDPPYGIGFMAKAWDSDFALGDSPMRRTAQLDAVNAGAARQGGRQRAGADFQKRMARDSRAFQAWCETWASECLRVLKPGGHLLAFGGTRTYHRLASGLEDAGFEIRDCLVWMYGSGFPKSLNLNGGWQGWGTALKPAHEPVVLARKPLAGTVAATVLRFGTGALNVDGCRIGTEGATTRGDTSANRLSPSGAFTTGHEVVALDAGRWPANVLLDTEAAEQLDAQTGESVSRVGKPRSSAAPSDGWGMTSTGAEYEDAGGASRFFYVAKCSRAERNAGLDGFEERDGRTMDGGHIVSDGRSAPKVGGPRANHHPTVKPVALMRWLTRLTTPPDGLVLDPFLGSGTTGIAAHLEGFRFVGIERDPDYMRIAEARIRFWQEHGEDGLRIVAERDAAERVHQERVAAGQLTLMEAL